MVCRSDEVEEADEDEVFEAVREKEGRWMGIGRPRFVLGTLLVELAADPPPEERGA